LNFLHYLSIVKSSVVRYIWVDLKYKFLLVTDSAFLIIDVLAFTILGGLVDSALTDSGGSVAFGVDAEFIMDAGGNLTIEIHDTQFNILKEDNISLAVDGVHRDYATKGRFSVPANELREMGRGRHSFNISVNHSYDFGNSKKYTFYRIEKDFTVVDEANSTSVLLINLDMNKMRDDIEKLEPEVSGLPSSNLWLKITDGRGNPLTDFANMTIRIRGKEVREIETEGDLLVLDRKDDLNFSEIDKGDAIISVEATVGNRTVTAQRQLYIPLDANEDGKNALGIDYPLKSFFLIGVLFWAFFHKSYEDTVNTIPDEAARGTIGFLVTNHVNLSTLLLSRNISSMLKTTAIALPCILLPLWLMGVVGENLISNLHLLVLVFVLMWFFMLCVSVLVSSLNIIFKKITPVALMVIYFLKIITGYYFPLEALDSQLPVNGMSGFMKDNIPLVTGVYFIRDVIIKGEHRTFEEAMTDTFIPMIIGTLVLAALTAVVYKYLERKSSRWGTLEFY